MLPPYHQQLRMQCQRATTFNVPPPAQQPKWAQTLPNVFIYFHSSFSSTNVLLFLDFNNAVTSIFDAASSLSPLPPTAAHASMKRAQMTSFVFVFYIHSSFFLY
jgi:hypothetical protein